MKWGGIPNKKLELSIVVPVYNKASKLQYINIPIYYYREGRENSLSVDKKNKELFVKSGYEILLNLLKINELKKFYTIKK